jgi:hypothetical protein
MAMDVADYEIFCAEMQYVEVKLDPTIVSQNGGAGEQRQGPVANDRLLNVL